jgi:hypothetical protein
MFDESAAVGFLSLHWHCDQVASAYLPIVDNARGGQFEMYYCSTECLRAFLGACVDELEDRMRKAELDERRHAHATSPKSLTHGRSVQTRASGRSKR